MKIFRYIPICLALGILMLWPGAAHAQTPTPDQGPAGTVPCTVGLSGQWQAVGGADLYVDQSSPNTGPWSGTSGGVWEARADGGVSGSATFMLSEPIYMGSESVGSFSGGTSPAGGALTFYATDADISVSAYFHYPNASSPSGIYGFSGGIPAGTWVRVDRLFANWNAGQWFWIYGATVTGFCGLPATATPVPQPTATPLPQLAMPCITQTVATSATATLVPTMTPYGFTTRTPTAGGPTVTPRPSVTPQAYGTTAAAGSFDSGVMQFTTDTGGLSALGQVNSSDYQGQYVHWSNADGSDGNPGVVQLFAGLGNVMTYTAQDLSTTDFGGLVTYIHPLKSPVGIVFNAKVPWSLVTGDRYFLRLWYLDPNYDGHGTAVWLTNDAAEPVIEPAQSNFHSKLELSSQWRKFGYVLTPSGGSGQIAAIGLSVDTVVEAPDGACAGSTPCFDLDNLQVTYGSANSSNFAACPATGAYNPIGGLMGTTPQKTCTIKYINVDVYGGCTQPTDILNVGGWVAWAWCRISTYFQWMSQNDIQADMLQQRQLTNEPLGTTSELIPVLADVIDTLSQMQAINHPAAVSPLNFVNLFNVDALDHPSLNLHVPDPTDLQYLSQCPQEIANKGTNFSSAACWAVFSLRSTIAIQLVQWILNVVFLLGIFYFTMDRIKVVAS